MSKDSPLPILWRRKWIVIATVVLFVAAAVAVSKTVTKVYSSSAELLIVQSGQAPSFDAVQSAQVSARTYGTIIASPNIAQLVSDELDGELSRQDLVDKVKAEPISETQLLRVTVTDSDPMQARDLADLYTRVFVDYVKAELFPVTKVSVSVADEATTPDSPIKPRPRVYVMIALLLGLGVGVGLAMLRELLDARIRSVEQIEDEFGLPILARLPHGGRGELDQQTFTEAFRLARLGLGSPGRPLRTLAVTSNGPGEGKSTSVTHLALALASSGTEVLLVEADIRRPALQPFFVPEEKEPLAPGLTNLVVGTATIDQVTYPTRYPSVELVPAGPPIPTLAGLLQSDRRKGIIREIEDSTSLALFDLPPLQAGADAATVSARADGVILVIDMEAATRRSIRGSIRQLESVHANVLGLVLNRDRSVVKLDYGYGYG